MLSGEYTRDSATQYGTLFYVTSSIPDASQYVNKDRKFVLSRIETSQKRQKQAALQLEGEGKDLAETQSGEVRLVVPGKPVSSGEGQYNWNARIFREREEALTMACEIPVLIEQRAFEIGKLIRAQMKS